MKAVPIEARNKILETFNTNPSGAFVHIKGYESMSGCGEVADFQIQSGVKYGNIKQSSIDKLKDIKDGKVVKDIHVECHTWKNPDGSLTNRKAKDRVLIEHKADYKWDSQEFQMACDDIMLGLIAPKPSTQVFEKEATGLYSIDGDALYIRDCLIVEKKIVQHGERPVSATVPYQALADAIRRLLPVSNYRTFKLDLGRFDTISINHVIIW